MLLIQSLLLPSIKIDIQRSIKRKEKKEVKPIGQHVVRIAVQLFHPCVISFRMEGRVYINGFKNPKRAFPAFLRCAFAVVIIPPTEGALNLFHRNCCC